MLRRRILIATYWYPPRNIVGARRPYALAKYLRRAGHDVTVLTSLHPGRGPDDAASRVFRTRDLLTTRLNWRQGTLDTMSTASEATWDASSLWGSVFVPDIQLVSWVPFAAAAARRLQRRHDFDVVITTSPTDSTHAVGLALGRSRPAWIADLRDGWRYEAPRDDYPLAAQRIFDAALERRVVRDADAVVTVSRPLADDLSRRHGVAAELLTNGFDPDERPGDLPVHTDPARLTVVHTGGMGLGRTARPVLEALARLDAPAEVILAGSRTAQEEAMYAEPRFAPFVRHIGFVERPQALALQRAADVLLLVTSGVRRGEVTGKLFEYLAAGKPIVVLGDDSEAARIVTREEAGWAIPVRDPDAAEALLRRILAGERPGGAERARERYSYPAIAARYGEVIERAIETRREAPRPVAAR